MQFELKSTCGMALHNILGRQGEDLAVAFLREKGLQILDRNWKLGDLETDIVAKQDDELVFVEVKTRRHGSLTTPLSAVDGRKQHRICLAADSYIKTYRIDSPYRFDVICVVYNEKASNIEHIEGAFRPRLKYY